MALNAAKVLVGTADQQSTTGAIRSGAPLASAPATFAAAETAIASMTDSGYVSEDGVELTNDISTTEIREWNRSVVRKVLDTFNGELSLTLIQSDYESWCQAIGSEYVTQTAATTTKGEQLTIKMGAHLAPEQSFAIAMKDGEKSYQTIATYTITDDQGQQTPAEGTIALNNVFFGSATGTISSRDNDEDLTGTQDGVTVTYALGSGGQRYCGTDHIRMYGGNKLTVSVTQGTIVGLEFELKESTTKGWRASTGTVSDYSWTGSAQSVTFHVDDGSGHAKIKSVKVSLAGSGVEVPTVANESQHTVYDMQGRKTRATRKGIYIRDGKKFVIR